MNPPKAKPKATDTVQVQIGAKLKTGRIVSITPCCYRIMIGSKVVSVSKRTLLIIQDGDEDCD